MSSVWGRFDLICLRVSQVKMSCRWLMFRRVVSAGDKQWRVISMETEITAIKYYAAQSKYVSEKRRGSRTETSGMYYHLQYLCNV